MADQNECFENFEKDELIKLVKLISIQDGEMVKLTMSELLKDIGDVVVGKEEEVGNITPEGVTQQNSDRSKMSDNKASNSFGVNPIKLVPMFNWDLNDLNEAKRCSSSFKALAAENQWSDHHARTAFESKLSGKGRSKYFQGLGNVEGITFCERMDEFERLFSRELNVAQSQERFWSCVQGQGESVTSFKLRLLSIGSIYGKAFKDPSVFNQLLAQQFIRGLIERYRIEVVRAGITDFHQAVKEVIRLEECDLKYHSEPIVISGIHTEEHELRRLVEKLQSEIRTLREVRSVGFTTTPMYRRCWGCGRPGHILRKCKHKKLVNENEKSCDICMKRGHSKDSCYMMVQQRILSMRPKDEIDDREIVINVNTAIEIPGEMNGEANECTEPKMIDRSGAGNETDHNDQTRNHNTFKTKRRMSSHREGNMAHEIDGRRENVQRVKVKFVNYWDEKPVVEVVVNGMITRALIDTGSQVSIINSNIIKDNDKVTKGYSTRISSPVADNLVDALSTTMNLNIGGMNLNPHVYKCDFNEMFPYDCLIGYEFLVKYGAVLDAREGSISIDKNASLDIIDGKGSGRNEIEWCQSLVSMTEGKWCDMGKFL